MRTIKYFFITSLLLVCNVTLFVSCIDGNFIDETPTNSFSSTRRIAVFAPADDADRLRAIASWVQANINTAQQGLASQVEIKLEWFDESDGKTFTNDYEAALTDDSVCAIIGPMESVHAEEACDMAARYQSQQSSVIKPIILPTVTATEVQRTSSDCKYLWCLSENDVTQSEVLVMLASQMQSSITDKKVCLIYSDDIYGHSFRDWIPFICSELGIDYQGGVAVASTDTNSEQNLLSAMNKMGEDAQIIIASSNRHHYVICDSLLYFDKLTTKRPESIQLIASDQALNNYGVNKYHRLWGVTPAPKPMNGFLQAYRSKMGHELMGGESEMYDAVLFLFYGLYLESMEQASNTANNNLGDVLYSALCRVVDGSESPQCSWTTSGIRTALTAYTSQLSPAVNGCTNDWAFSNKVRTTVTNSYYLLWSCINTSFNYITYLTNDTSGKNSSIKDAWSWCGLPDTIAACSGGQKEYRPLKNKWALLIAGSTAFDPTYEGILNNYRHQADVLAMYQMLKRHGYDDEHIVLIIQDDIAQSSLNPIKGNVHYCVGGENVREGAQIDYTLTELDNTGYSYGSIPDILTGKNITIGGKSKYDDTKLLHPDENDDVLIYWCGHADAEGQLCWLDNKIPSFMPSYWINSLQQHGVRKVLVLLETCYSGMIGSTLTDYPGVLTMTAANETEQSFADNIERDPELGNIYLSNGFSNALIQTLDKDPGISLFDLYIKLAANTCGSHVKVYGTEGYGSLYNSTMLDYLK